MIRDARHPVWTKLWHAYVLWRLKRSFRGVWVDGALPATDEPLILYANHCSFWDGFVAHAVVAGAGRDGYAVMEERQLRRYRFLTRLGALSIRRGDPRSSLETLRHCRTVLERPRATLVIFPQGRLESARAPLRLERGVEVLARSSGAKAAPLALRYAFFEHEYPDVLASVGAPHQLGAVAQAQAQLQARLDALAALDGPFGLTPLVHGRRSVADAWPFTQETA